MLKDNWSKIGNLFIIFWKNDVENEILKVFKWLQWGKDIYTKCYVFILPKHLPWKITFLFQEANEASSKNVLPLKSTKCPIKRTCDVFLDCRSNDSSN